MSLEILSQFLDQNPCLSESWKERVITMVEGLVGEVSSPSVPVPSGDVSIQEYMDFIELHEGKRNTVYQCPTGHPTIGIGFNLDRGDARMILEQNFLKYDDVLHGIPISDTVIYTLFKSDVNIFLDKTKELVPSFDDQPRKMKLVLVDMCFNLGKGGLSKFRNFLDAVEDRNYSRAAAEMIDSRWYSQVGNRSKKLVKMVKEIV